MRKIIFLAGLVITAVIFSVSYFSQPKVYPLKGTYQGSILNSAEEEIGIYTVNFVGDHVNFFSAQFKEAHTNGTIKKAERENAYEFIFADLKLPCVLLSRKEMQLTIDGKDYVFLKKSDVPISDMKEVPVSEQNKFKF